MKKGKKILKPIDKHNIAQEYVMGATAPTLAKRYGVGPNYIYVIVREMAKRGKIAAPNKGGKYTRRDIKPNGDSKLAQEPLPKPKKNYTIHKPRATEPEPCVMHEINAQAVESHKIIRRGFHVPKHLLPKYDELLRSGKTMLEIQQSIENLIHGQKL